MWLIESRAWNQPGPSALLLAFDALNVATELYRSNENSIRDHPGEALRFTIPNVANGRVYMGVENLVEVYGLLPSKGGPREGQRIVPGKQMAKADRRIE